MVDGRALIWVMAMVDLRRGQGKQLDKHLLCVCGAEQVQPDVVRRRREWPAERKGRERPVREFGAQEFVAF